MSWNSAGIKGREGYAYRALAAAGAADDGDPLPGLEREVDVFENVLAANIVSHSGVAKLDGACPRPAREMVDFRWTIVIVRGSGYLTGLFLWLNVHVLLDSQKLYTRVSSHSMRILSRCKCKYLPPGTQSPSH